MKWSEEYDLMLCREVLVLEPWKFPKQTKERRDVWGEVALDLNGTSSPKFKVSKRSARDRLTLFVGADAKLQNAFFCSSNNSRARYSWVYWKESCASLHKRKVKKLFRKTICTL